MDCQIIKLHIFFVHIGGTIIKIHGRKGYTKVWNKSKEKTDQIYKSNIMHIET